MKAKIFSLVLLTTLLLTTVSASLLMEISTSEDLTKAVNSTNLIIKNNEAFNITVKTLTIPSAISDGTNSITITNNAPTIPFNINAGQTQTITLTKGAIPSRFKLGAFSGSVSVYAEKDSNSSVNDNKTATLTFVNGFCKYGEIGSLEITELEDREIDNEDAWEWHPLDNVEFKVEVFNNFDDDKRIKIEYELVNSNGKKADLSDEVTDQSVSIDNDDSEKVTFSLRVPADIDDGDYRLFLKAYVKSDESEGCIDSSSEFDRTYYQEVNVVRENDREVVIDMDSLQIPDSVNCGDSITISAKVYNLGTEDEEKVKVNLYNKVLGVNLDEIINNFDSGDSATINFNFKVPENIEGKDYLFEQVTYYEYDEDDDVYDSNSKSDLDKNFDFRLKVNCVKEIQRSASITAELESEAVAGQQLLIKGTLKNTGVEETGYTLSIVGYKSWATLDNISPSSITLKAGESKDFDITLTVNKDAVDEQFFTIKASYNGKITEQEVSVTLEGEEAQGVSVITGATITENLKKNWFIWVIVVINIILIIAIIAVARRIVKSR